MEIYIATGKTNNSRTFDRNLDLDIGQSTKHGIPSLLVRVISIFCYWAVSTATQWLSECLEEEKKLWQNLIWFLMTDEYNRYSNWVYMYVQISWKKIIHIILWESALILHWYIYNKFYIISRCQGWMSKSLFLMSHQIVFNLYSYYYQRLV